MILPGTFTKFIRTPTPVFRLCLLCMLLFLLIPSGQAFSQDTEQVTFNFVDVELPVVVKFVSEFTGKNTEFVKEANLGPTKAAPDNAASFVCPTNSRRPPAILLPPPIIINGKN